eukprot:2806284-Amphidinium_carterae.5
MQREVFCDKATMDTRDHWELHGAWLHRVHSTPRSTTFKPDWGLAKVECISIQARLGSCKS